MRRHFPLFLLAFAVIALGLTTTSGEVFARAGGGGNGGGDIISLILLPFFIIYSVIVTHIVNKKHRQCKELLQRLETNNAMWDSDSIKRRVETIYFKVQLAWMKRDQSIAQKFMSDRLYSKHKTQTDQMLAEHRKNVLKEINLKQAKVVNVADYLDESKDYLWVYIKGSMIDYMVNDQTGEKISGDSSKSKSFAELWKLVRGKTGWVLDEIEQDVSIFELSSFHPFVEETGFFHRPDANPMKPSLGTPTA